MSISAPKVAITTMLKNPDEGFESFLSYHLRTGFAHVFLFFDDPEDPSIARVPADPRFTVVRCDERLRRRWQRTQAFARLDFVREHIEDELIARQTLNAEVALGLALDGGFDWLLYVDTDELFYSPGLAPVEHFARMSASGVRRVKYLNYEAIPERAHVRDYFREVTLFKVNPQCFEGGALGDAHRRLLAGLSQIPDKFFYFYQQGKSAVRLCEGIMPVGAHDFLLPEELEGRPLLRTEPISPAGEEGLSYRLSVDPASGRSFKTAVSRSPLVLHYPCCGFGNFWSRYKTLGGFGDKWFGSQDITARQGPYHTAARDVVASGDARAAEQFYRERNVLEDESVVLRLMEAGLLQRIVEPSRLLSVHSFEREGG
ncbi:MAG TPA: glycosyltransferase family 2 protein [Pyrinomonadaceae bacterium]|nr:glycosyltransferase family 2 protein [Pyrinomonadaceae bacterium]